MEIFNVCFYFLENYFSLPVQQLTTQHWHNFSANVLFFNFGFVFNTNVFILKFIIDCSGPVDKGNDTFPIDSINVKKMWSKPSQYPCYHIPHLAFIIYNTVNIYQSKEIGLKCGSNALIEVEVMSAYKLISEVTKSTCCKQ